MKFRKEYIPRPSDVRLNPRKPVLLLGSCFTDSIGSLMRISLWNAISNPVGVLYNPMSIARALEIALSEDDSEVTLSQSIHANGPLFVSDFADSSCSSYNRATALRFLKDNFTLLKETLQSTQALIVTFGTAWVYETAEEPHEIVANCHKFPAERFRRRRLTVAEIVDRWAALIDRLRMLNPKLNIIFTVSPIRHLKDGFSGNSLSKAILRLACEEICSQIADAEYFPSFEILTDDLRDYRFYESDLTHPSSEAVEYIWEKFCETYLCDADRQLVKESARIKAALSHRPIIQDATPEAVAASNTLHEKALSRLEEHLRKHPGLLNN